MEKNNFFLILVLFINLVQCNSPQRDQQKIYKYYLQLDKNAFISLTNKNNWFTHFPKKVDNFMDFFGSPPTTPPGYDCLNQTGEVYLVVKKDKKYNELINKLIRKAQYKTYYKNKNEIKISYKNIKNDSTTFIIDTLYFKDKLPIPYFEDYNPLINETKNNKNYKMPDDCVVYVMEAKPGPDIWKFNCNEKRNPTLKEWMHGYSEGICISDEYDIIIFWTILW